MSDPFLENCGGWTPAPDTLTKNKRYGFEGAYLWGRLRRLCQLGGGQYTISHEALGERIGMSRRTVIKYLDRLIEDGYVEDFDTGVKNKAHTYSVKKGEDKLTSGMQNLHTEIEDSSAEFAHQNGVGVQDLHSECAEIAQQGMQNLHLNREYIDTSLRDNKRERESHAHVKPERVLKDHKEIALKLISLCGYVDPKFVVNGKLKECADSVLQLIEWAVTPELLGQGEFGTYWWGTGPPTFKQVVENWGKFLEWRQRPKEAGKEKTNGQSTAGHRQTYKTKQNGRPLDPRAMDTTAIEREIADLERKLGARQNRPDLSPG